MTQHSTYYYINWCFILIFFLYLCLPRPTFFLKSRVSSVVDFFFQQARLIAFPFFLENALPVNSWLSELLPLKAAVLNHQQPRDIVRYKTICHIATKSHFETPAEKIVKQVSIIYCTRTMQSYTAELYIASNGITTIFISISLQTQELISACEFALVTNQQDMQCQFF